MASVSEGPTSPPQYDYSESEVIAPKTEPLSNEKNLIEDTDSDRLDEDTSSKDQQTDFSDSPLKTKLQKELSTPISGHSSDTSTSANEKDALLRHYTQQINDDLQQRKLSILLRKSKIAQLVAQHPDGAARLDRFNQQYVKENLKQIAKIARRALENYRKVDEKERPSRATQNFDLIKKLHDNHFKVAPEEDWGLFIPSFLDEGILINHQTIYDALQFFKAIILDSDENTNKSKAMWNTAKNSLKQLKKQCDIKQAVKDYCYAYLFQAGHIAEQCETLLKLEFITNAITGQNDHPLASIACTSSLNLDSLQMRSRALMQQTYHAQQKFTVLLTKKPKDIQQPTQEAFNSQVQLILTKWLRRIDQHWCQGTEIKEQEIYWLHRLFISLYLQSDSDYPLILWRLDTVTSTGEQIDLEVVRNCSERIYQLSMTVKEKSLDSDPNDKCRATVLAFHQSFQRGCLQTILKTMRASATSHSGEALKALESASTHFAAINCRLEEMARQAHQFITTEIMVQTPPTIATFKYEPEDSESAAIEEEDIDKITPKESEAMLTSASSLEELTVRMRQDQLSNEVCLAQYILFSKNESISQLDMILLQLNILERALAIALIRIKKIDHANLAVMKYASMISQSGLDGSKALDIKFIKAIRALPNHVQEISRVTYELTCAIDELEKRDLRKVRNEIIRSDLKCSLQILLDQKKQFDDFLIQRKHRTPDWLGVYRLRGQLIQDDPKIKKHPITANTLTLEEVELSFQADEQLNKITELLEENSKKISQLKIST